MGNWSNEELYPYKGKLVRFKVVEASSNNNTGIIKTAILIKYMSDTEPVVIYFEDEHGTKFNHLAMEVRCIDEVDTNDVNGLFQS